MKLPFRSAPRALEDDGRTGLDWFGPVEAHRPLPVAPVLVSATLVIAIPLAAIVGLDILLDGIIGRRVLEAVTFGWRA